MPDYPLVKRHKTRQNSRMFFRALLLSLYLLSTLSHSVVAAPRVFVKALFDKQALLEIDGKQHMLKRGQTKAGVTLLKADSEKAVIRYEGKVQPLYLDNRTKAHHKAAKNKQAVVISADRGGMYSSHGWVNGFPTRFLIDTGASSVAMNLSHAKHFGVSIDGARTVPVSTANGTVHAYVVTLDSVRIGHITLKRVEALVQASYDNDELLLGMSFLGRLDMRQSNRLLKLYQP